MKFRLLITWMLFTFALVNAIAIAIFYANGEFHFYADSTKFILLSLALYGWDYLRNRESTCAHRNQTRTQE